MRIKTRLCSVFLFYAAVFSAVTLSSCAYRSEQEYTTTAFTFDTFVTFRIIETDGTASAEAVCENAVNMLNKLENRISAQKPDSEISKINRSAYKSPVTTDSETYSLIKECTDFCKLTNGAFDITLGDVSQMWGFGNENPQKPDFDKLKLLAGKQNYRNIIFDDNSCSIAFNADNFSIDLGAAGKGYALDELKKLLEASGVTSAVVDFGGSILTIGAYHGENWKITVSTDDSSGSAGTLSVPACIVSTSNAARRYVEYDGIKYHHILDTDTAFPSNSDIKSCTVISDSGIISDMLSTAAFVMGKDEALSFYKSNPAAELIITCTDGQVFATDGIADSFTVADN